MCSTQGPEEFADTGEAVAITRHPYTKAVPRAATPTRALDADTVWERIRPLRQNERGLLKSLLYGDSECTTISVSPRPGIGTRLRDGVRGR